MAPLWSSQSFKIIYVTAFVVKSAFGLPLLLFYYAFKPLRPLPDWNWRVSFVTAILRSFFSLLTAIRYQRPRQLEPGIANERFVLIEPPASHLFSGVLTPATANVKPAPVGAVWFPIPAQKDAKRVVIHFAGGAFVLGWDPEDLGKRVAKIANQQFKATTTLYAQYRLAGPEAPFPAAVQDGLVAYHHVLSLGIPSRNIFFSGDSAGGNLALALLRYLETSGTPLPLPGGVMAWSPWIHITADVGREFAHLPNADGDVLVGPLLQWGADAYLPQKNITNEVEAFVDPLHHPFRTQTPVFIQGGSSESFYDLIKRFAAEMSEVEGNRIRFHTSELAPHDLFAMHHLLGLTAQAEVAMRDARDFFEDSA